MLRFTDANLKLISDIEKYQFVESAIMGGISMICKGFAEANNIFLKSYDANKPTSYHIFRCKQFIWTFYDATSTNWNT